MCIVNRTGIHRLGTRRPDNLQRYIECGRRFDRKRYPPDHIRRQSVKRFSTAHRLPATRPSPTTDSVTWVAARQLSMAHQLRPTLPSITGNRSSTAGGQTIFNDTSTAGHATITNQAAVIIMSGGETIFNGSSTADSAILIANGTVRRWRRCDSF